MSFLFFNSGFFSKKFIKGSLKILLLVNFISLFDEKGKIGCLTFSSSLIKFPTSPTILTFLSSVISSFFLLNKKIIFFIIKYGKLKIIFKS